MRICPKCQHKCNDLDVFCPLCGTKTQEVLEKISDNKMRTSPPKKKLAPLIIALVFVILLLSALLAVVIINNGNSKSDYDAKRDNYVIDTESEPSESTESFSSEESNIITKKENDIVNIKNLKDTAGFEYWFTTSGTDPRGETYTDILELRGMVELYTAGKYSTFNATLDPEQYFGTSKFNVLRFRIFADDEVVYTSPDITYKTNNLEITANIKNAEYIKLEMVNAGPSDSYYSSSDKIILYNATVSK